MNLNLCLAGIAHSGGIEPARVGSKYRNASVSSIFALAPGVPFLKREEEIMKTKLLVAALLAGSSLFAETRFSIGVGVGHGYAALPVFAYRAPSLGPGYTWVDGYWDQAGPRRTWHNGYWARRSYRRPFVAEHRIDGNRFESNGYDSNGRNSNDNRSYRGGSSNFTNGNNPAQDRSNVPSFNGANGERNRVNNPNERR